ncbi:ciliated left-right organizer metallopeptidase-like isoform X1 [Branchiostoma lanceolatum]|uniref:ciliated left-right organizer metallopeptidase-like isoform X1 n=1 Tax=Branchiostoma lanceolatum TaxID=7740 RepID=UPI0034557881
MSSWVQGLVYLLSALVCVGHLPAPLPTQHSCIFDDIEPSDVPRKTQTYVQPSDVLDRARTYAKTSDVSESGSDVSDASGRARRDSGDLFRPLRITPWFHNIGSELGRAEQDSLREVVREAVGRITRALAVVPVQGSLVLGRNFTEICKFAVAANQPNAGKCSVARSTYPGEICIGEFPIPAAHLEGFATWDDTGETPAQVLYTEGAGVADTDFILYVTAATTTRCQNDHSVLAYASYCQLDQNSRPTAGYTNFCPVQLQGPGFDRDKFVMTAVHELLHALGFSKQLFDKFKDCSSSADPTSCPDRRDVVETVRGLSRLTTPAVLNRTRHHFSCTWTDFGGPLEDRPAGVSSHWEARLMQGSIMTAKLGQPHLTTIDAVTLAVFEDSGWYQVDYSTAGSLVWGQDQGCTFGTEATCVTSNDWFCLGSSVGCHYLHLDKGRCESDSYLGVCRVYKPQPGDECWKGSSAPSTLQLELHGESYQEASRCFVSNLTKTGLGGTSSPAGRCYEHRCNSTGVLEVRVQGSPWVRCPFGFSIVVPGYSGALACPPPGALCRDVFPPPHTTAAATTQGDSCPTGAPDDRYEEVQLEVTFPAEVARLTRADLSAFRDLVAMEMAVLACISRNRVAVRPEDQLKAHLVIVRLYSAHNSTEGPGCAGVFAHLEASVRAGRLIVTFRGTPYRATGIRMVDGKPVRRPPATVAVAMGVVGGLLLLVVVVVLIFFYKAKTPRTVAPATPSRASSITLQGF